MNASHVRYAALGAASFVLAGLFSSSALAQNLAIGRPIIDGSSSWDNAPYNGGNFPASRTVDGGKSEPNDGPLNYWLGSENRVPEHFTLDLQEVRNIDE